MQFFEIILSKPEYKLLREFAKSKQEKTFETAEIFDRLFSLGFIESDFVVQYADHSSADYYILTDDGRRYLEYYSSIKKHDTVETIRYLVTTFIAVAALIMSIISIVLQQS